MGKAGWESPGSYRSAASFSSPSGTGGDLLVTINLAMPIQGGRYGRNLMMMMMIIINNNRNTGNAGADFPGRPGDAFSDLLME